MIFLHHLHNLEDTCLAKQVLNTQIEYNYPGLYAECLVLLDKLALPNPIDTVIPKMTWKRLVKSAIMSANEEELKESFTRYKKLRDSDLAGEGFGRKDYLSKLPIYLARTKFSYRVSMTRYVMRL